MLFDLAAFVVIHYRRFVEEVLGSQHVIALLLGALLSFIAGSIANSTPAVPAELPVVKEIHLTWGYAGPKKKMRSDPEAAAVQWQLNAIVWTKRCAPKQLCTPDPEQ